MTRVEQKCVIASAGLHLLLLGILMAAPVFINHKPPIDDSQILEFIPLITTDLKVAPGGGDRTVRDLPAAQTQPTPTPPQPQPEPPKPAPTPQPEPEPVRRPEPKPEPKPSPVEEKKDPDSLEVTTKKPPVKPVVNLTRITRKPDSQAEAKARAQREVREAAEAQRRLTSRLNNVVSGVRGGISSSTEIRLRGPGTGGVPYANFYDAVKSVYYRELTKQLPDSVDDSGTVEAVVVIAKNGDVISSRITKRSGIAAADRAVQNTLNNVRFAAPLPATETKSQREVTINFNISAIRQLLG